MSGAVPSSLAPASRRAAQALDGATDLLFSMDPCAAWATWEGHVPWRDSGTGEDLPGVLCAFRRVGKPYEYQSGDFKVRGHDVFIMMRTRDVLAGGLRAQALLTVEGRNFDFPPQKYKVRMVDEMGDGNAFVYLYELGEEPPPDPPHGPPHGGHGRDRHFRGQGGRW